ncbi:GNAT superfamily N-acetyltransferase [Microbacterium endophyticum]|uniref:GNAT superfamily N-acetyltransferase n=2 Tax=Microbacterium TaxID=33882 RepID=A0A7W3JLP0_9MICO|nr:MULTISPECIES: GNAT family N-acetyltransferase [Microbacterium]MBA8815108.1 GNAT superfamily N-acetyltransferase [Microbacterium halimionae]MBB2975797.1 GNAT superfamily N-acetyltransferase [Microbacterium endophyticum]NII94101.1 GNAT superfamily N-acetyltransferase [Microbacterium halimionae]NIK36280.1 GNAT superfamily N-acetyltransferase [Microbacterium endophyticum]
MEAELTADVIVRPVRDVDAEALGRVHATCWHETYDHLISKAALERISTRRLGELWTHWASQGDDFRMSAALVNGEIVGFVGSGPARDKDAPRNRELYFIYLLDEWHGTGIGQQLFDAAIEDGEEAYLWVAEDNPRAHRFYVRNGFSLDGANHTEPFLGETLTEVRFVR